MRANDDQKRLFAVTPRVDTPNIGGLRLPQESPDQSEPMPRMVLCSDLCSTESHAASPGALYGNELQIPYGCRQPRHVLLVLTGF